MSETARVLNGEAGVGDRVAYATRIGNGAGVVMGTITALVPYEGGRYDRVKREYVRGTVYKLKVEVEAETRSGGPRIRTVSHLDRVVKI